MALGLAMLAGASSAPAQEKAPDAKLAILIVGDEANTEMLREEKALIAEMTRLLAGTGGGEGTKYPHVKTLQVYSYHFNQPRERQYCEKKLNILAEDLLFVGLVELKDKLPRRVVYRLDRIARPSRAAADILTRAEEVLAPETVADGPDESPSPAASTSPKPAASPSASPKPAASPTAPPRTTGVSAAWCIQAGSYSELQNAQDLVGKLKEKGYDPRIEESTRNGATLFRVYVGSYPNRQEAQSALEKMKADGFDKAFVATPEEG